MTTKSKKKRFTLPRLIILLLLIGVIIMGGWVFLRTALLSGLAHGMQNLEAQGYQIGHEGLEVQGFPLFIDASTDKIMLRAPASNTMEPSKNWTVSTQNLHLKSKPLWPLSWSIIHDGTMRIDMRPGDRQRYLFEIVPAEFQIDASATITGTLKQARFHSEPARLAPLIGNPPFVSSIGEVDASIRTKGALGAYSVHAQDFRLVEATAPLLVQVLGPKIDQIDITGEITDWSILQKSTPEIWQSTGHVIANQFLLKWGTADIIGDFDFGFKNGLPQGSIRFRIKNLDNLYQNIRQAGLIDPAYEKQIAAFLSVLDTDDNGRSQLEFTMQNGVLKYGFLTLYDFTR